MVFFSFFCLTGTRRVARKGFPFLIPKVTPQFWVSGLREAACLPVGRFWNQPQPWLNSMDVWAAAKLRNHLDIRAPGENISGSVCIGFQSSLLIWCCANWGLWKKSIWPAASCRWLLIKLMERPENQHAAWVSREVHVTWTPTPLPGERRGQCGKDQPSLRSQCHVVNQNSIFTVWLNLNGSWPYIWLLWDKGFSPAGVIEEWTPGQHWVKFYFCLFFSLYI